MASIAGGRVTDERVTCLRIFADANGETHMEDIDVALQPRKLFKDNPPLRLSDNFAASWFNVCRVPTVQFGRKSMRRRDFLRVLGGAGLVFASSGHAADDYPNRPVRIVVPYPPGGGTDIVARILGEKLQARLGRPIVIDNRGGAGGVVGTGFAAKAVADGYTLLLVPTSHVINPSIHAHLSYDTVKDFAPISTVASATILMAVNPRVPAHSVRELVEAAKARPQSMATYGSA